MKRLVQILVVAAWIAGALIGGRPDAPTEPDPTDDSVQLLVDTNYAQLGVTRSQAVLTIRTPWQSTSRVTAPLPVALTPNRSAKRSRPKAAASPSVVPFVIRALASLL